MSDIPTTVLGLSIGTRQIGAALLDEYGFLKVKMIVFPGRWDAQKLDAIIATFKKGLHAKRVTAISLKIPHHSHHSPGLTSLIAMIKSYCTEQHIQLHICTITELKTQSIGEARSNKKILMNQLAQKYPLLVPYIQREYRNRHKHYIKMFEAVAAAELFQQLNNN